MADMDHVKEPRIQDCFRWGVVRDRGVIIYPPGNRRYVTWCYGYWRQEVERHPCLVEGIRAVILQQ